MIKRMCTLLIVIFLPIRSCSPVPCGMSINVRVVPIRPDFVGWKPNNDIGWSARILMS